MKVMDNPDMFKPKLIIIFHVLSRHREEFVFMRFLLGKRDDIFS